MEIKLHKLNNKLCYYKRSSDNEFYTAMLDDYLKIEEREETIKDTDGNEVTKKVYSRKLQVDSYYVYIPIPMIGLINDNLGDTGYILDYSELGLTSIGLEVNKYEERLRSIYGQYSDKLIEVLQLIDNYSSGLINLPTGFGKTWMIAGLVMMFLNSHKSGDIMVMAAGSAVVNELKSRLNLFGVNSDRVIVANTASVRAQRFYDENWINTHRSNIELVIIDECDSITETMVTFLNSLPNYKYIFGMSASPDTFGGQKLDHNVKLGKLMSSVYRILMYVGTEIINNAPEDNINLVVIDAHFSDKKVYMESEFMKFKQAVQYVVDTDAFIDILEYVSAHTRDTLYLPINNKALLRRIILNSRKRKSKLQFIYWDAGELVEVNTNRHFKDHIELNKWLLSTPANTRPNIILSTRASYRGVSLPSLTDILLVENSNYRNVIQNIGRTMRSESPTIWIPRETGKNNVLFFAMATKRLRIINKTYPNLKHRRIEWKPPKERSTP